MLKIHIFKALGLRSGDWFGKNDVYVQAYVPQAGSVVSMDKALPEPVMDMILPVGQFTIPFSFQLPSNLPSSMVSLSGDDYIAYSVYAHIDIAWKSDPSTRHFFTVMQHQNPSLYLTPSDRLDNSYHVYTTICCPCVCFGTQGNLTTKLHLDRTAYAPGEKALLRLEITSDWADFTTNWRVISVGLQQIVTCWAEGFKTSYNKPLMMPHMIFNNNPGIPMTTGAYVAHDVIIPIPITPPTYAGGLGRDSNWLGEVSRYGGVWASQSFDPIVWTYSITVELKLTLPGMSCGEESVFFNLPVVVTAVNKMSYDSILAGNDIFAATTRGQGSNGAQPRANVPSMPQQQQPMMMNQQQPMMMMGQQQQPMIMNQQQPMVMAFGQQQPMMMMGQQQQPMMTMTIGGTQQQPMMMMSFGQQQQPMMMMMGQQQPMMMMGQQQPMMGMGQQQPMMGMAQPQVAMGTVVSVRDGSHQHMQQTPVAKPASYDTPYQQKVPIQTETPVLIGAPYASPQTPAHPIGQDQGAALSSSYYGNDYGQSGTNSYANLPTVAAQTLSIATPQIAVPVASGTYGNSGSNQAGGYNADDYMHAPEANPAFSGVEVVKSTTQRVIRDPEEDFTVQNELELMYCPLYFKVN